MLRQIDANGIAETVWSEPTGERIEAPMQSLREKRRASKVHSMQKSVVLLEGVLEGGVEVGDMRMLLGEHFYC